MVNQPAPNKLAAGPSTIKLEAPVIGKLPDAGLAVSLLEISRVASFVGVAEDSAISRMTSGAATGLV
jgi:hypothetical protein